MPEESGGSVIGWLMYAFVVYWIAASWRAHLSRLEVTEDVLKRRAGVTDTQSSASPEGRSVAHDHDALLSEIVRREAVASIDEFLANILKRYETIIAALNAGDREVLLGLVSSEVYRTFEQVIADRETAGLRVETLFARIDTPEIIDGTVDATHMEVSVRFIGEAFNVCRNAAGELTEERPAARRSVDIWTFARKLTPPGSKWCLVATRSGI